MWRMNGEEDDDDDEGMSDQFSQTIVWFNSRKKNKQNRRRENHSFVRSGLKLDQPLEQWKMMTVRVNQRKLTH